MDKNRYWEKIIVWLKKNRKKNIEIYSNTEEKTTKLYKSNQKQSRKTNQKQIYKNTNSIKKN